MRCWLSNLDFFWYLSVCFRLPLSLLVLQTGELFAQCPVDSHPGLAVESVTDSSRYFVIRIKDESGLCKWNMFFFSVFWNAWSDEYSSIVFRFWYLWNSCLDLQDFIKIIGNLFLILGRSAFIGIGFDDRSDSFDLNVALQDHFK